MSFRGWGQIIKPWLLRSLTRYAVQPLFVRFSWKHWNVLTLPSCGKQNRNFVYIRETHTHTHTRDKVLRGRIDPSQTDTHISPLQPFDLVVGWLFQFHMPFVSICDQYDKYRFLLFCGLEPETKISLFLLLYSVCIVRSTFAWRYKHDRPSRCPSFSLHFFIYYSKQKKKIARADVRLTGPAKTCSQLPNNWSGSGTAAISSDLFIYFYQCSIARSNFYLRKIFKSRLFLFFSFLSFSLSLLLLLGDNIVCSGRRRLCILLIIFFVSLSFSVFSNFAAEFSFFFWLFHFSLCTVCFPSLLITEIVDIRFLKIHISFHWFFFSSFLEYFPVF